MSNAWDCKFAFYIKAMDDVPREFQDAHRRLVEACGRPAFAVFSPAIEVGRFLFSHWLPPRLILLFPDYLMVLSLETRSNQVQTLDWSSEELLGYGQAEFEADCWFTLYPRASSDQGVQIRFPSQAAGKFTELGRLLRKWLEPQDETLTNLVQFPLPGLPKKLMNFLEAHDECRPLSEFLFQPAMDHRGTQRQRWPNLLMLATISGIVVLTDVNRGKPCEFGIEMTYLPIQRVRLVDWMEPRDGRRASMRVCLKGKNGESVLSWPVYPGLKPYALRWSTVVNSMAAARATPKSHSETVLLHGEEDGADSAAPGSTDDHRRTSKAHRPLLTRPVTG